MPIHFDFIIIGGGLAGLQLALNLGKDRFFEQKSVAIIDPSLKTINDKTWCFWEKGESEWDNIANKTWKKGLFLSSKKKISLELSPYSYKMIKSLDFYNYVRSQIQDSPFVHFIQDEITSIDTASTTAIGVKDSYSALHIFDSRITSDYKKDPDHTIIFQHFKGWLVETEEAQFDPSAFTMMDYRLKYNNSTSFFYVLPVSETRALVEFTFFTPYLTEEKVYDQYLGDYVRDILRIKEYKVTETEMGVIPMTDYPFHRDGGEKVTKIGTGASWVKGSTGYSFKHTEKKVNKIIENMKEGRDPSEGLLNKKARFYDSIFLDVLYRNNELGERIFSKLYRKNSPQEIFKYLDEETTFKEDIKIMFSLFHPQFIFSFFRKM